jgi:hypothetical protein
MKRRVTWVAEGELQAVDYAFCYSVRQYIVVKKTDFFHPPISNFSFASKARFNIAPIAMNH